MCARPLPSSAVKRVTGVSHRQLPVQQRRSMVFTRQLPVVPSAGDSKLSPRHCHQGFTCHSRQAVELCCPVPGAHALRCPSQLHWTSSRPSGSCRGTRYHSTRPTTIRARQCSRACTQRVATPSSSSRTIATIKYGSCTAQTGRRRTRAASAPRVQWKTATTRSCLPLKVQGPGLLSQVVFLHRVRPGVLCSATRSHHRAPAATQGSFRAPPSSSAS